MEDVNLRKAVKSIPQKGLYESILCLDFTGNFDLCLRDLCTSQHCIGCTLCDAYSHIYAGSSYGDSSSHGFAHSDAAAPRAELSAYCDHHVREQGIWLCHRKFTHAKL